MGNLFPNDYNLTILIFDAEKKQFKFKDKWIENIDSFLLITNYVFNFLLFDELFFVIQKKIESLKNWFFWLMI